MMCHVCMRVNCTDIQYKYIQICVHKYIRFKNGGVRVNIAFESLASSLVLYKRAVCSVYTYIILYIVYYIHKLHSHS
jgi:hypothetical protein